jgi:hypothetical protein
MKSLSELRQAVRRALRETVLTATAKTGTVTAGATATALTGTSTTFLTDYQVGDEIQVNSIIRTVRSIASNTSLTINKALGTAATTLAHYLVQRQGGWTDEELDDRLQDGVQWLEYMIVRHAPRVFTVPVTANLVAGADTIIVPTGLRRVDFVEIQPSGGTGLWTKLQEYLASSRAASGLAPWWGWSLYGANKTTGQPTAFSWRGADLIELNCYSSYSLTNGIQFWGTSGLTLGALESSTLQLAAATSTAIPDSGMLETALINETAGRAFALMDSGKARADAMRALAMDDVKNWVLAHGGRGGRSNGTQRVRITGGL